MRYSIYDGQKETVTLAEELGFLNNYIELHTARYHKKIDVRVNKHIQQEGVKLKPLLFIILLENAFKHGVENLREKAFVHIDLVANEKEIVFTVENNFEVAEAEKNQGIGLKNLHRRLELVYPKKHSLTQAVTHDIYKTQLTLKLI
jgi:two-component system, LytTR family, sensor histidine kinase AlgZ